MKERTANIIATTITVAFVIGTGWALIWGGQPQSCPVPGHGGPPCNMKQCAAMGKDGAPNGARCSKYCAKQCCLCEDKCPKDTSPSNPDEAAHQ